ncbi:hypothetical protein WJX82_008306 [Trebouxia sp. C0006]
MDHTALWWHIGQDFRDVVNHAPDNFLNFSLLDVSQKSPTTQQLGLQAALRLLARCRCSDCDLRKGGDPRIGIAKLLQAFAASPNVQQTTSEISKTLLEQLAVAVQDNTVPETPTELILRLCMGLYTETWSADNVTDDQVKRWMDKYHIHTVSTFLNHKDYRPGLSCKLSCTTSGLLKYGLSYHDLEWFSRGALVTAVLKAYKQPGMVMSSDLTNKMTRHAQRLIALAPKNPASFEMLSYVQMKNTDTLPDAAKYMLKAKSTAAANGDHVGVVRYGLQSLYFLLWMHSMKPNSEDNRAELEHEVQPVLEHVQSAEARSKLYARSNDIHDNNETQNSWQSIARPLIIRDRVVMNHSLSPSATRLNLQQDFADAGDELPMPIMWEGIGIEVFKVHESSPRAHILGLPAAVSLLNQSKCPSYDMFKAIDPRICTAKLVQAFIACPRIHSGTCGAAKTCSEQMEAFIQQEPEPVEKSSLVLMLCAQLLHETTHKQHGTEKHMVKWLRSFHNRICLGTLLQKHCVSLLNKGLKDITSGLAAYGLQYQDLEWFSRAAMVSAVLKEYKQADKGMSTELTSNITRHVKRMIALAPDNPAGYEMMSYVLMKNTSTLQEAAMNMRKAMSAARANGDDTGLVQYALQCMYFMLWMHSMKPDSVVQRAELKQEIQPLLEAAQLAETHSGLHARSTDSGDADSSSMRAEVPQNLAGVPEPVPEPSWGVQLAASQQTVSAGRTSSATTAAAQATAEPGISSAEAAAPVALH